jgi:Domain of unknown function (DUF3291)
MAQLAQINIGRLVAPLDDPRIADFLAQLDEVNALAEQSAGFVWRLKSDSGNATDISYSADPFELVNMSVWESVESLDQFTYGLRHISALRDRRKWFEKPVLPHYCLWWVPDGHIPSVKEARERLEHYQKHGANPHAFWFSQCFPASELESVST